MQIYVEKIIIFNVVIHLLLIFITRYLTNNKINRIGLLIGVILGIINMYIYFFLNIIIVNYLLFIIIPSVTFKSIKSTLLYIMFNLILGGITGVINLSINYYYEVIFLCSISILLFIYILRKEPNNYKIDINGKIYNCFYDTGCIVSIGLTPVIILNSKYNLQLEYFTTLEVNTIAGVTTHKVYKASSVYLLNNNKKTEKYCLIILSDIDYDVIIGKNFLGGI